jgi:glycosyltransferase involved in cell wall biosynthesis
VSFPSACALEVSVVMAVHNGRAFLADAVGSVLGQAAGSAQGDVDLELILVDDGSTDDGIGSLDGPGLLAHPRLRCLRQAQKGTAAARNQGVTHARGASVAFLDQDDLWPPGSLALRLGALAADPTLEFVLGHVWQGSWAAGLSAREVLLGVPGRRLPGHIPSTLLIRRKALERLGGFQEDRLLAESFDWFVRAREQGARQRMLSQIVALRRLHAGNKGHTLREQRREYAAVLAGALRRRRSQSENRPTGRRPAQRMGR